MKRLALIISVIFLTYNGFAKDLRDLFTDMPESMMPLLTKSDRMDCMDYMDSGMKAVVTNKLGGNTEMLRFDKNYLSVQLTEVSTFDMKLFYHRDSSVLICVIQTVCSEMCDSRLSFYDGDWKPIDKSHLIEEPILEDYLIRDRSKRDSIDFISGYATLRLNKIIVDDEENGLKFTNSSIGYMSEDVSEYLHFFNPEPLLFKWNGKVFKRSRK